MRFFLLSILLILNLSLNAQVHTDWAFNLVTGSASGGGITGEEMVCDPYTKDVYICGHMYGTSDFDPSPAIADLTSFSGFVAKYDSLGNYKWSFKFSGDPSLSNLALDNEGNLILSSYFEGFVDLDPSSSSFILSAPSGGNGIFFAKYTPLGNFIFGKAISADLVASPADLDIDSHDNIYITGYIREMVDFDPSGAVANLYSGAYAIFIAKYDSLGNYIFAHTFGGEGFANGSKFIKTDKNHFYVGGSYATGPFLAKFDSLGSNVWTKNLDYYYHDICIDEQSNIYGVCEFGGGETDFDPSPAEYIVEADFSDNLAIVKSDLNGSLLQVIPVIHATGKDIQVDENKSVYVTGWGAPDTDYDPSMDGIAYKTPFGDADIFVAKYDSLGNYVWAKGLGGSHDDEGNRIFVDNQFNIVSMGVFALDTLNFFGSSDSIQLYCNPLGGYSTVLFKYSQGDCESYNLLTDTCIHVSCGSDGQIAYTVVGGTDPLSISWSPDSFLTYISDSVIYIANKGIYSVNCIDYYGCEISKSFLISGPDTVGSNPAVALNAIGQFRPNFSPTLVINGYNKTCLPSSGSLVLVLDSAVTYISSDIIPDSISDDSLIWNYTGLEYGINDIIGNIQIFISPLTPEGQQLCFDLKIIPASADIDTFNNEAHYCYTVLSAIDPNQKQVYPQGINGTHAILNNQMMTYSVQFQNTGTADAINIYVLDTLDPNLDLNTVNVISSSHYMFTEVLPGNVLKFNFPNIHLADSTSDEPNSHGYFIYEVNQSPNIPHNTVIENTAAIYFDYNDPVFTNTVFNTIDLGAQVIASANNFCPGDSTTLTVIPNVPGLQANWQWFESACSGTYIGNGSNIMVTPLAPTTYFVKDSASALCFSTIVNTLPVYFITQNTNICAGDSLFFGSQYYHLSGSYLHTFTSAYGCDSTVTLNLNSTTVNTFVIETDPTLTASATPATYQWIDCNTGFAPLAGQTSQSYTATGNGNYAVIITQEGCTDTSACYSIISTGISEALNSAIIVYPNPVGNELNIVLNNTTPADITLTDMTGQVAIHQTSNGQTVKLQTGSLGAGVYCLAIFSDNQITITKVIKE